MQTLRHHIRHRVRTKRRNSQPPLALRHSSALPLKMMPFPNYNTDEGYDKEKQGCLPPSDGGCEN
jgi:hypothetical protein